MDRAVRDEEGGARENLLSRCGMYRIRTFDDRVGMRPVEASTHARTGVYYHKSRRAALWCGGGR